MLLYCIVGSQTVGSFVIIGTGAQVWDDIGNFLAGEDVKMAQIWDDVRNFLAGGAVKMGVEQKDMNVTAPLPVIITFIDFTLSESILTT